MLPITLSDILFNLVAALFFIPEFVFPYDAAHRGHPFTAQEGKEKTDSACGFQLEPEIIGLHSVSYPEKNNQRKP